MSRLLSPAPFQSYVDHNERQDAQQHDHAQQNKASCEEVTIVHVDHFQEFLRYSIHAEQFIAFHFRAIETKYGQGGALKGIFQKRYVKQPVEYWCRIHHAYEES